MTALILKRPALSRPPGEWNDDDFDVLADGAVVGPHHEGARRAGGFAVDVDSPMKTPRRRTATSRRARPRWRPSHSKRHIETREEYIGSALIQGNLSSERTPEMLVAWDQPNCGCNCKVVKDFHALFVLGSRCSCREKSDVILQIAAEQAGKPALDIALAEL